MGLGLFGSSYSEFDGYVPILNIEPKADFFRINQTYEINGNLVAIITYPNCTNFEGKKILVFRNMSDIDLRSNRLIDPHFSNKGLSPFARFVPSKEGLNAAKELCKFI
ncbi:hypothetical protein D3C78_1408490 [compost metagenome]